MHGDARIQNINTIPDALMVIPGQTLEVQVLPAAPLLPKAQHANAKALGGAEKATFMIPDLFRLMVPLDKTHGSLGKGQLLASPLYLPTWYQKTRAVFQAQRTQGPQLWIPMGNP